MRQKFFKGIATGAAIGTAVSMLIVPELNGSNRRKIKKTTRNMTNAAEDAYDTMRQWINK